MSAARKFEQVLRRQARVVRVEPSGHAFAFVKVWLAIEAAFSVMSVDLTPAQARRVARALLRFADGAK